MIAVLPVPPSQLLPRSSAQRYPFPSGSVRVILIRWWNLTYMDITELQLRQEQLAQPSKAQSACNLISRFVIQAYLIPIFHLLIFFADSPWQTHIMLLAILREWVTILFYTFEIVWMDGFPADHDLMTTKFANAFFRMGLLGQANNHNVSNRWCVVKVYPSH